MVVWIVQAEEMILSLILAIVQTVITCNGCPMHYSHVNLPEPKVKILARDGTIIASCEFFDEASMTPSKCQIAKGHSLDEVMDMTVTAVRGMKSCDDPTRNAEYKPRIGRGWWISGPKHSELMSCDLNHDRWMFRNDGAIYYCGEGLK